MARLYISLYQKMGIEPDFRLGEASNARYRNTYHLHIASSARLG